VHFILPALDINKDISNNNKGIIRQTDQGSRFKVFYLPCVPKPTVQTHWNCFAGLSESTEVHTHYNNNNKKKKYQKLTVYKVVEYPVLSTVFKNRLSR